MPIFGEERQKRVARVSWAGRRLIAQMAAAASGGNGSGPKLVDLHQPWQTKVFGYYNRMGEAWSPGNFTARAMSKIRLYAAKKDASGDPQELPENHWASQLVAQWQAIPEPYGRLLSLIGEGRFCQMIDPVDADRGVVWEFLSPVELKKDPQGRIVRQFGNDKITYTDISSTAGKGDPGPGEIRMWRFWRPHPENSGYADSSFRGIVDLLEQLWWITLSERADLRNRVIDRGLLLVDEDIEFEVDGAEDQAVDGEDTDADPFSELLFQVITATLQNPGSAEAAAPPVIRGPGDLLHPDRFRWMRLSDPSSSLYVTGREDALMRRISIGLDMPAEAYMGLGTLNHWNAWKLDDEKYQHVQPTILGLLSNLTTAVLQPIGRASNEGDADEVFVAADIAQLVSDPDKGKTALALYSEGIISAIATAEANDFSEEDLMKPEEKIEWRLDHGRTAEEPDEDPEQNEEPPDDAEPEPEAPEEEGMVLVSPVRFAHAAQLAARAAVSKWVTSKKRSCPECFEGVDANDQQLIATLGPEKIARLGIQITDLTPRLRDAWFASLGMFGCSFPTTQAHRIEEWFAATLWEKDPVLPDELAERLVL